MKIFLLGAAVAALLFGVIEGARAAPAPGTGAFRHVHSCVASGDW
jgi:hypothetical protein